MRRPNREVNIFNMSLLDILCGALGAFCFMMLSLFPDHAKVKNLQARLEAAEHSSGGGNAAARAHLAEQQAQEARRQLQEAQKQLQDAKAEQSLVWFRVAWSTGQDIDAWIETPSGKVCSSKPEQVPQNRRYNPVCKFDDQTKGPAFEGTWFDNVAYEGATYRLFARLQNRNGVLGPASVHGYLIARAPGDKASVQIMGMKDLGEVALPSEHVLVELGWVQFRNPGLDFNAGAKPGGDNPSVRLDLAPDLRFRPPDSRVAAVEPAEQWRVDRWH
jgi:hypothetical protein